MPPSTPLFWLTLTHLGPAAVQFAWQRELGPEYPLASPFLAPTTELATLYPCTHHPPCHCWHEIQPTALATLAAPGTPTEPRPSGSVPAPDAPTLVALCTCGPEECYPIDLAPADALLYALDPGRLAPALRQALNSATPAPLFDPPPAPIPATRPGTFLLATCGPAQLPVYFHSSPDPLPFLLDLLAAQTPFILATPTEIQCQSLLPLQSQHPFLLLPLSQYLALESPAAFRLLTPLHPALEAFQARLAHPTVLAKTLAAIHRELATIRTDFHEVKTVKEQLQQMQSEGLLKFIAKIDPRSFRLACAILTQGDVAKASRALKVPDSSIRNMLRRWKTKGPAYTTLLELVRWRKHVAGNATVPFNDQMLYTPSASMDSESLLADVLDGLLSMTESNWHAMAQELSALLRPHVPR